MKTYHITFYETRAVTTDIEADSVDEAQESFEEQHRDGEWETSFGVVSIEMQIEEQIDSEKETT